VFLGVIIKTKGDVKNKVPQCGTLSQPKEDTISCQNRNYFSVEVE